MERLAEVSLGRDTGDRSSPSLTSRQLTEAAELRRRRAEDRGRNLVEERTDNLEFLRERAQRAEAERNLSERTAAEKQRIAQREVEEQRRLDEQRLDDFQRMLDEEIKLTEQQAAQKRDLADEEAQWWARKQKEAQDLVDADQADRERATEAAAARQADILLEPFRNLSAETSGIFTNIFDDFLSKGQLSADAFGESLTASVNRSFATLASTLVASPLNTAIAALGDQITQSLKSGTGLGSGLLTFAQQNPEPRGRWRGHRRRHGRRSGRRG